LVAVRSVVYGNFRGWDFVPFKSYFERWQLGQDDRLVVDVSRPDNFPLSPIGLNEELRFVVTHCMLSELLIKDERFILNLSVQPNILHMVTLFLTQILGV
jgi:hypothetical protein